MIEIEPSDLSLNYISNSNILQFFEALDVSLDSFYQLLWRHIFVVALIQKKYGITNETAKKNFFLKLTDLFNKDGTKKHAIEYVEKWGSSFWLETESRVKEVTNTIETNLKGSIDIALLDKIGSLSASNAQKLSTAEKEEVVSRCRSVVNGVQLQALSKVFDLLNEDIFINSHKPYYVVIDRLDENWVESSLRFKLIRALIETIKSFRNVNNIKIIIALRADLLDKVIQETRDYINKNKDLLWFMARWAKVLYEIGMIGVKTVSHDAVLWAYQAKPILPVQQITNETAIYIHPMFWRALGTNAKNSKSMMKAVS